jgi:cytochrome P450 family 4
MMRYIITGGKYAMLSMKTTIALVVRRYHLETTHKMEDIKTRVDVLLRSINGYPVKISERRRKSD